MADKEGGDPRRSKDALANEIVELLRQAARKIIELGDKHAASQNHVTDLRDRLSRLEHSYTETVDLNDEHHAWEGLLLDYRSGIRDKDELLEGTVGR